MKYAVSLIVLALVAAFFLISHKTPMTLSSGVFENKGVIPAKYTCDGVNTWPDLHWAGEPANTKTFALIMDDPDAVPVAGRVWDHWVLFNIPASVHQIQEGVVPQGVLGVNSSGKTEYQGPCPPNGEHRYHFKLYALDIELPLEAGVTKDQLLKALEGHIFGEAELVGLYNRVQK